MSNTRHMENLKNHKLKPISFSPEKPEDVLANFLQVDPKKVDERLKKSGVKKDKK